MGLVAGISAPLSRHQPPRRHELVLTVMETAPTRGAARATMAEKSILIKVELVWGWSLPG